MKPTKFFTILFLLFSIFFSISNSIAQTRGVSVHRGTSQVNQITIRSDRVFELNNEPFFPIGICFENGETAYHNEFYKNYPWSGDRWGFNFINLFNQNEWLYDNGYRNVISGDTSTSSQYRDFMGRYWGNITWRGNYDRIDGYLDDDVYLLADGVTFTSDDATHWEWTATDTPTIDPPFNQTIRNQGVLRIDSLAQENKSNIIGFYSMDDANFFQAQGPEDPMYYYNNFRDDKIENLDSTYDFARYVYPNSIVLMSIVPFFFPKAFDPSNWTNFEDTRAAWIEDAKGFSQGANVLFSPAYMSLESWNNWADIYEDPNPNWFPRHIKETLIDEVLDSATENKAVLGGIIFDVYQSNPADNDSLLERKVKWTNYVGLQQGATGLIYFGWHVRGFTFPYNYPNMWNAIKRQVDTLANVLNLDQNVFVKGNSGTVGHSIASSLGGGNATFAVYKANSWSDFYLLVTNNPTGAIDEPAADNTVTITTSVANYCFFDIKEVFSNSTVTPSSDHTFSHVMPWYSTALFHIKAKDPAPIDCDESRPEKNQNNIPDKFYLNQNYPNPFNPVTEISFGLPKDEFVTIDVYNSIGQKITSLINDYKSAGKYNITFDASGYASGLYIYKIKAGNFTETRKMLLVK